MKFQQSHYVRKNRPGFFPAGNNNGMESVKLFMARMLDDDEAILGLAEIGLRFITAPTGELALGPIDVGEIDSEERQDAQHRAMAAHPRIAELMKQSGLIMLNL